MSNAPSNFQCLMTEHFKARIFKYVLIFLEDIRMYKKNFVKARRRYQTYFGDITHSQAQAQAKEVQSFSTASGLLGLLFWKDGTQPVPNKWEALRHRLKTASLTGVSSFVGFCKYYRRFHKDFEEIAEPLSNLKENTKGSPGPRVAKLLSKHLSKP